VQMKYRTQTGRKSQEAREGKQGRILSKKLEYCHKSSPKKTGPKFKKTQKKTVKWRVKMNERNSRNSDKFGKSRRVVACNNEFEERTRAVEWKQGKWGV